MANISSRARSTIRYFLLKKTENYEMPVRRRETHFRFFNWHWVAVITFQWRCPSMQANDVAILVLTVCFIGMFAVQLSGIFILISYYRQPSCHVSISLGIAGIATGLPFFLAFSIGLFVNAYFSRYWVNWRRINKRVIVNLGNSTEPNIVPV